MRNIRSVVLFAASAFIAANVVKPQEMLAGDPCDLPAWNGTVIIDCESSEGWQVEGHSGSTGNIKVVPAGLFGQAIRLNYQLSPGCGGWIQARYDFDPPANFAVFDLFGVSLHGLSAQSGMSNRGRIMVADTKDVFFGATIGDIAHIDRWLINMPLALSLFTHQSWSAPPPIDWTQINRLLVVVEPGDADACIQAGSLTIDHIQGIRSADWVAPEGFVPVAPDPVAAQKAIDYLVAQQCASTGLFRSWSGDPDAWAWLYDQALALLALTRERRWAEADMLAEFLVTHQAIDGESGHWAIGWNYCDPAIEHLDEWPGDQAWTAYALHRYAILRGNQAALQASIRSGNWLAQRIRVDGCVNTCPRGTSSTEGNFDVWMAMMQLGRTDDADRIAECLLTTLWDNNMRYWPRGEGDPVVALNANTWPAKGFALHPRINRPDIARNALRFVRRTLATRSDVENICDQEFVGLCGLDFQGPVTLHAEGMASYVVAGGPESHESLDTILALQQADGGVHGSTEDWSTDTHWLTCWKGMAPTAWLYFAVSGSPFVEAPNVLYVDGNATGTFRDGSTWCNAFVSLQDALATAASSNGVITEIRVADGIYRPDQGEHQRSGDRRATFRLLRGVALRGGYAGCGAPNPDLRDIEANPTILSGDLDGDDVPVACAQNSPDCDSFGGLCVHNVCIIADHNDENSIHVVTGSGTDATAGIDGFTVTAGNANVIASESEGGGMYNNAGSPMVNNCTFRANATSNFFGGSKGGGMSNSNNSNPIVTNCTFIGNSANFGGGMENGGSNPTVTNCTFSRNTATVGGGMSNVNCSPAVANCTFSGNLAFRPGNHGGGMANGSSSPTVINCTFSGNTATNPHVGGGGMSNSNSSGPTVTNCTFSGNSAFDFGGGMYNNASNPAVTNCILWGNIRYITGVVGNPLMDSSAQISGDAVVDYSIVQGGWAGPDVTGVLNADPLFVDPAGPDGIFGNEDDNLRLRLGSPAIDAGDNDAVPVDVTTDLGGNPRFVDDAQTPDTGNPGALGPPVVDMGANEFQPIPCASDVQCDDRVFCNGEEVCNSETGFCERGVDPCPLQLCHEDFNRCFDRIYVNAGAHGANNGTSWPNAYRNLQDALATAAAAGGSDIVIWVAGGFYFPDRGRRQTPGNRTDTFQLISGVAIYAGFAGWETSLSQRNIDANPTIISGDLDRDDALVTCEQDLPDCNSFGGRCADGFCVILDNNAENSFHVVTSSGTDASAVLDGFTVSAGNATGLSYYHDQGGGLYTDVGSPTVTNCTFSRNSAGTGGGIANSRGNPTLTNCTFIYNSSFQGGGMSNGGGNPTLLDCTFRANSADLLGGGMFNEFSNPIVTNSTFIRNRSSFSGGGIYNVGSSPIVTNCTFSGNSSNLSGGGLTNASESHPTLTNCVFNGNSVSDKGGGVRNVDNSNPAMTNCTFNSNSATAGGGMNTENSNPTLTNCILWGNSDSGGTGQPAQIHVVSGAPNVNYSIVQGGWSGAGGVGNVDADPLFVDADGPDNIVGTEDDNLRVPSDSPAIDAGDNDVVPLGVTTDLDRHSRFLCERVDIGAYEYGIGDYDCNGMVNLADYVNWDSCFTGPGPGGGACPDGCEHFDFDFDGDVDLHDFSGLQLVFDGSK